MLEFNRVGWGWGIMQRRTSRYRHDAHRTMRACFRSRYFDALDSRLSKSTCIFENRPDNLYCVPGWRGQVSDRKAFTKGLNITGSGSAINDTRMGLAPAYCRIRSAFHH